MGSRCTLALESRWPGSYAPPAASPTWPIQSFWHARAAPVPNSARAPRTADLGHSACRHQSYQHHLCCRFAIISVQGSVNLKGAT